MTCLDQIEGDLQATTSYLEKGFQITKKVGIKELLDLVPYLDKKISVDGFYGSHSDDSKDVEFVSRMKMLVA